MRSLLKRVLRTLLAPVYSYFEPRFRSVHEHLDVAVDGHLRTLVDARSDGVEDHLRRLYGRVEELETRVTTDTQTAAEFAAAFRRATEQLHDELAGLRLYLTAGDGDDRLPELLHRSASGDPYADIALAKLLKELVPGAADRVVGEHIGVALDDLGPGTADFLNWAGGHTSPAGQAGVWFNPPVTVFHSAGSVRPNEVNERIVEVPYAMSAAAALEPGARVLDFGAAESTVALSLASLGFDVTAADLHPYPFEHPRVRSVTGPIEDWDGPDEPLAAIFCVSALEHVGLGAYGEDPSGRDLDRRIVERFASWLRPGGELVFTAPYGRWEVGEQQRVYDADHLDSLLAGWTVGDRQVCVQTAPDRWERAEGEPSASTWDDGTRGVILLRATPVSPG